MARLHYTKEQEDEVTNFLAIEYAQRPISGALTRQKVLDSIPPTNEIIEIATRAGIRINPHTIDAQRERLLESLNKHLSPNGARMPDKGALSRTIPKFLTKPRKKGAILGQIQGLGRVTREVSDANIKRREMDQLNKDQLEIAHFLRNPFMEGAKEIAMDIRSALQGKPNQERAVRYARIFNRDPEARKIYEKLITIRMKERENITNQQKENMKERDFRRVNVEYEKKHQQPPKGRKRKR